MKSVTVSLSAAGNSAWLPIDYRQVPFALALAVNLSQAANLTVDVQFAFDRPNYRTVLISRVGTTATVTDVAHQLKTGDSIIVQGAGSPFDTDANAGADITVTGNDTYTYTVANSGPTFAQPDMKLRSFRPQTHATLTAITGAGQRVSGSITSPVTAVRLKTSAFVAGVAELTAVQGQQV